MRALLKKKEKEKNEREDQKMIILKGITFVGAESLISLTLLFILTPKPSMKECFQKEPPLYTRKNKVAQRKMNGAHLR